MPYKGKGTIGAAKFASKITTSEGFKLSLFRYPEDASPKDQPNQQKQPKPKAGNKK
ncbi:hypothetical protein [Acinetobacter bereziniae]|uniref:hypothetical protein n=1 Tax=Acinetobacter bereziniae TaxID=106648 RepID=UPI00321293F4